jgi:hypothetical protein
MRICQAKDLVAKILFAFGQTTSVLDRAQRSLPVNLCIFNQRALPIAAREMLGTQADYNPVVNQRECDLMLADLKFAWRRLFKSPSFAVTAVLTLALGIGANAVVFSVLNALVLHTINVPNAQRFYSIEEAKQSLNSYPDYLDVRDRNRTFDGVLAFNFGQAGLATGGDPV